MKRSFGLLGLLLLSVSVPQVQCGAPHWFWPQKDVSFHEVNDPSLEKSILVASRRSEFKNAIVDRIGDAFRGESVYIKFIGIKQLKEEDGAKYDAVVLINTCMAGSMDRHVKAFIKRHTDQKHMIVLTTSGDGAWLPDMEGRHFDAISSASQKDKIDEVADQIIAKMRSLLDKE